MVFLVLCGLFISFIVGHYIGCSKGRDQGLWEATSDVGFGRP